MVGLDKHMRKAIASGGIVVTEAVSASQVRGEWDPRSVQTSSKPEKVEVQAQFWNMTRGAVETTTAPNKTQKRKHQINSLAFQAKQMEGDINAKKFTGLKTKAQTYGRYGW